MSNQSVLEKYNVLLSARLSSGMEADVYTYGTNKVLKIYTNTVSPQQISILKAFYDTLNHNAVPYALPQIFSFAEEGQIIVSIEKRLVGKTMSSVMHTATEHQLDELMTEYLDAALALQKIEMPMGWKQYKLYDDDGISQRSSGDWHRFLARYLDHKRTQIENYLAKDIAEYAAKLKTLHRILERPYTGEYRLIHGDFFPGNLLVDENNQVTALLDFGLFTMYGDPLFDLATGWVFFDMYDELKVHVYERYLNILLKALGESILGKLHLYVLLYSVFSANTYSPVCKDGHYTWCIQNLNNEAYWNDLD